MIYHKSQLIKHCVATYYNDRCNDILLYIVVVHFYECMVTYGLANHLSVYR